MLKSKTPLRKLSLVIFLLHLSPFRAQAVLSEALSSASGAFFESSCQEKKLAQVNLIKDPIACDSCKKEEKASLADIAIESQEKLYMNWAAQNQANAARCEKTRVEKFKQSKQLIEKWIDSAVAQAALYQSLIKARAELSEIHRQSFYPVNSPEAENLRSNMRQIHQAKKALLDSVDFSEHESIRSFLKRVYEDPRFSQQEREKWLRKMLPKLLSELPDEMQQSAEHLEQQRTKNEFEFDSKKLFANSDLMMSYMKESGISESAAIGLFCRMDSRYGSKYNMVEMGFTIGSFALEAPVAILAKLGAVTRIARVGRLLNRGSALLKVTAFSATTADAIRMIEENCIGNDQMSYLGANRCERIRSSDFENQERLAMQSKTCGLSIALSGLPVMALPYMTQAYRLAVDLGKEGSLANALAKQGKRSYFVRTNVLDIGPRGVVTKRELQRALSEFNLDVAKQNLKVSRYSEVSPSELLNPGSAELLKMASQEVVLKNELIAKVGSELTEHLRADLAKLKSKEPATLSRSELDLKDRLESCLKLLTRFQASLCVSVGHEDYFTKLRNLESQKKRSTDMVEQLTAEARPNSTLELAENDYRVTKAELDELSKDQFYLRAFKPGKATSANAKFTQHKDFPEMLERLKKADVKLVLDPYIETASKNTLAYFDPNSRSVHVHPGAPYHIFIHEVDHALFNHYISSSVRRAEMEGYDSFKDILHPNQIKSYGGPDKIKRVEELIESGLRVPISSKAKGVREQLAVDEQLRLLGFKRYFGKDLWWEMYGLLNQQNDFEKIKAAVGSLNSVQQKTFEANNVRLGLLTNLSALQVGNVKRAVELNSKSNPVQVASRILNETSADKSLYDFYFSEEGYVISRTENGKIKYLKLNP